MEIKMPRYGNTMESGEITEWYVKVGDHVEKGTELCEITDAKLSNVLESEYEGTVKENLVEEGDEANVGDVIMVLE